MSVSFDFPILALNWHFLCLPSLLVFFRLAIAAAIVLIDELGHVGREEQFRLVKVGGLLINFEKQPVRCVFYKLVPRAMNPFGLLNHLLMLILLVKICRLLIKRTTLLKEFLIN